MFLQHTICHTKEILEFWNDKKDRVYLPITYTLAQAFGFLRSFAVWTCVPGCIVALHAVATTLAGLPQRPQDSLFRRRQPHCFELMLMENLHSSHSCCNSNWRFSSKHLQAVFARVNGAVCWSHRHPRLDTAATNSTTADSLVDSSSLLSFALWSIYYPSSWFAHYSESSLLTLLLSQKEMKILSINLN